MTPEEHIDHCFREGMAAAENEGSPYCPHDEETVSRQWWQRGYSYGARLLRVQEAERRIQELEEKDTCWNDIIAEELGCTMQLFEALGCEEKRVTEEGRPIMEVMLERIRTLRFDAACALRERIERERAEEQRESALTREKDVNVTSAHLEGGQMDMTELVLNVIGPYRVFIEHAEEGYIAACPTLPGCITQGDTFAEAVDMIRDAIEGHLHVVAEHT